MERATKRVLDSTGTIIDPATEETLQQLATAVGTLTKSTDVQQIAGTVNQGTAGDEAWPVSLQGPIPITNAELISVPASITEVLLLAENIDTKTFSIYNNSVNTLYVKFHPGVTQSFFNFKMPPFSFYEPNIYTFSGSVYGVWDGTNGTALISQLF